MSLDRKFICLSKNIYFHSEKIEAVAQRCSVKKVFLEILQNSEENTCARVFFLTKLQAWGQVFFCEFCETSRNTFSYRTPPVVASGKINFGGDTCCKTLHNIFYLGSTQPLCILAKEVASADLLLYFIMI